MHRFVTVALEFIQICSSKGFQSLLRSRLSLSVTLLRWLSDIPPTPHPPQVDLQQVSRSTSVIPSYPPQHTVDL